MGAEQKVAVITGASQGIGTELRGVGNEEWGITLLDNPSGSVRPAVALVECAVARLASSR